MNITKLTNAALIKNFFSNLIDMRCDDDYMVRYNMEHEMKIFCESNIEKMKECIIEEPYLYGIDDDIDVIIITSSWDDRPLFTLLKNEINW